jgi:hypothetical protein
MTDVLLEAFSASQCSMPLLLPSIGVNSLALHFFSVLSAVDMFQLSFRSVLLLLVSEYWVALIASIRGAEEEIWIVLAKTSFSIDCKEQELYLPTFWLNRTNKIPNIKNLKYVLNKTEINDCDYCFSLIKIFILLQLVT